MSQKTKKTIALLVVSVYVIGLLPAQEIQFSLETGGIQLEYYLDRAAREKTIERWERLAEEGVLAALSEWETQSTYLKEHQYDQWLIEYNKAKQEYKTRKDADFVSWLTRHYYEQSIDTYIPQLKEKLQESAQAWTLLENEQKVVHTDLNTLTSEYKTWQMETESIINAYMQTIAEEKNYIFTEINSRIKDTALTESNINELVTATADMYQNYILSEYKKVSQIETNSLFSDLLYTKEAPQRLHISEVAAIVAQETIETVKYETELMLTDIFAEFNASIEKTKGDNLELDQENWLNQFKKTFAESLQKWEDAEVEFLASRLEWEDSATHSYIESENAWTEAYEHLKSERASWEEKVLNQFTAGVQKWREQESQIIIQLEKAESDFLRSTQEGLQRKEQEIDMHIDMYNQSRQMLATIAQGIQTWFDNWSEKYRATYYYWKTEDTALFDAYFASGTIEGITTDDGLTVNSSYKVDIEYLANGGVDTIIKQINEWKEAYTKQVAANAHTQFDNNLWESSNALIDTQTGWFSYVLEYYSLAKDTAKKLFGDTFTASLEKPYTNSLDTQIIQSQQTVAYWKDELEIAQALYEYSLVEENRFIIANKIDTELDEATELFQAAQRAYADSLEYAEKLYDTFLLEKEKVTHIEFELERYKEKLQKAHNDYAIFHTASLKVDSHISKKEIATLIDTINTIWQIQTKKESDGLSQAEKALREYYIKNMYYINAQYPDYTSHEEQAKTLDIIALITDSVSQINSDSTALENDVFTQLIELKKSSLLAHPTVQEAVEEYINNILIYKAAVDVTAIGLTVDQLDNQLLEATKKYQEVFNELVQQEDATIFSEELYSTALLIGYLESLKNELTESPTIWLEQAIAANIVSVKDIPVEKQSALETLLVSPSQIRADYTNRLLTVANHHIAWLYDFTIDFDSTSNTEHTTEDSMLLEEELFTLHSNYAQFFLTDQLEQEVSMLLDILSQEKLSDAELDTQIRFLENAILSAQNEVNSKQTEWQNAIQDTLGIYAQYSSAVLESDRAFKKAKEASLEQRKKQEIYNWASSIYLANFGSSNQDYMSPKEKLVEVEYAYNRALIVEEELTTLFNTQKVENETYKNLQSEYEQSSEAYYLSEVILNEALLEISLQFQTIYELEWANKTSASSILKDTSITQESIISDFNQRDLIQITHGHDGYTITLSENNYLTDEDTILLQYLTEDVSESTYLNESILFTQAQLDTIEWLEKMQAKGHEYYNAIVLASLYLKSYSSPQNRDRLFIDSFDPLDESHFNMGDIPTSNKFHNVDVHDVYNNAKYAILHDAYNNIINVESAKEDIAKYILYKHTTLAFDLNTEEKLLFDQYVLQEVIKTVKSKYNYYASKAKRYTVIAASAAAAAGFFTPWLFGVAAYNLYLANHNSDRARSLGSLNKDIAAIKDGRKNLLDSINSEQIAYLVQWQDSSKSLPQAMEVLRGLYYGSVEIADNKQAISYEQFVTGVDLLLEQASISVNQEQKDILLSKEVFMLSGANEKTNTAEALVSVSSYFDQLQLVSQYNKDVYEKKLKSDQEKNILAYQQNVSAVLDLQIEQRSILINLSTMAANTSLTEEERNIYKKQYDEYVQSLQDDSLFREQVNLYAGLAWGANTWDQKQESVFLKTMYNTNFDYETNYSKPVEEYAQKIQKNYKALLLDAFANNSNAVYAQKKNEWQQQLASFFEQERTWLGQMALIKELGQNEWNAAEAKLNHTYQQWKKAFVRQYEKNSLEWTTNYASFLTSKNEWISEQYVYATNIASAKTIAASGASVDTIIAKALTNTLQPQNLLITPLDTKEYVGTLLADTKLSALLKHASLLQDRSYYSSFILNEGSIHTTQADIALLTAKDVLFTIQEDMETLASSLAVEQARKVYTDTRDAYMSRLQAENAVMRDWQKQLVLNAGYNIAGNEIYRNAIIGATLNNPIREKQTVYAYKDFVAESPTNTFFLFENTSHISTDTALQSIKRATESLELWANRIFGAVNADGTIKHWNIPRSIADAANIKEYAQAETKGMGNNSDFVSIRDGEFGEHLGYEPIFKTTNLDLDKSMKKNILKAGRGQIGLIMQDYYWNSLKMQAGYAELALPSYDKRLWDDSNSPIKAPTMRAVADISMNIVGSTIPGFGSFLLSLSDDVFFSTLDITGGYKTGGDIAKHLVSKTASTGLNSGLGGLQGLIKTNSALSQVVADTAVNLASSAVYTTGSQFISNIDFAQIGTKDWFDSDSFKESMGSLDTWANTIGSLSSGMLNIATVTDGLGYTLESSVFNTYDMQKFNSFFGNTVSSGIQFAQTGSLHLNILNSADIASLLKLDSLRAKDSFGSKTNDYTQVGLLEVDIGKDGLSFALGEQGLGVSVTQLSQALKGLDDVSKIIFAKASNKLGDNTKISELNSINALAYTGLMGNMHNYELAQLLWNDSVQINFADLQTEYGYYNTDEENTITISNSLRGNSREQASKLATVLAHEGSHVFGNSIEGIAHQEGIITYNQLSRLYDIAREVEFTNQMLEAILSDTSWIEDTAITKNWQILQNGNDAFSYLFDSQFDFERGNNTKISAEDFLTYLSELQKEFSISDTPTLFKVNALLDLENTFTNNYAALYVNNDDKPRITADLFYQKMASIYGSTNMIYDSLYNLNNFYYDSHKIALSSIAAKELLSLPLDSEGNYTNNTAVDSQTVNNLIATINTHFEDILASSLLQKTAANTIDSSLILSVNTDNSNISFPMALNYEGEIIRITSGYGLDIFQDNGAFKYRNHYANDFAGDKTDAILSNPLIATEDNLLYQLGWDSSKGLLYSLYTLNDSQPHSLMTHLSENTLIDYFTLLTTEGVSLTNGKLAGVTQNTQIGYTGSTGSKSTGNHLHYELFDADGLRVDAMSSTYNELLRNGAIVEDELMLSLSSFPNIRSLQTIYAIRDSNIEGLLDAYFNYFPSMLRVYNSNEYNRHNIFTRF